MKVNGIAQTLAVTDEIISKLLLVNALNLLIERGAYSSESILGDLYSYMEEMETIFELTQPKDPYLVENEIDNFINELSNNFEYPFIMTELIDVSDVRIKEVKLVGKDAVVLTI